VFPWNQAVSHTIEIAPFVEGEFVPDLCRPSDGSGI